MAKNTKIISVCILVLIISLLVYYYQKPDSHVSVDQVQEITLCSSTIPPTCYTYTCENGYLVADADFGNARMPGGPNINKICTDGSEATETVDYPSLPQ
jgi:hypothetical protein